MKMGPTTAQDFVTVGPPGVDPEFYGEDLLNEYQIPANDTKMMPQISRSNTFHYEPQGNRLTSITVNDPPARDTYLCTTSLDGLSQSLQPGITISHSSPTTKQGVLVSGRIWLSIVLQKLWRVSSHCLITISIPFTSIPSQQDNLEKWH